MVHYRPPGFVATCTLACLVVACSSSATSEGASAPGHDGGPIAADSGAEAAPGPGPVDGSTDASVADGASDASHAAVVPTCRPGDRQEWSGPVGSTGIAVAVCSVCGASYVVASSAAAGAVATSANLADKPTDGTVTVCATAASHACLPMAPENQRYCNPYRDVAGLVPERVDQGVDYGGSGPIYAMAPGTIDIFKNRTDTGWPGGTFVSYKLSAGPAAGRVIYLAENIDLDPMLSSGSFVYSGTVLGTLVHASPDSESGWGVAGEGVTAEYGCYTEGCATPLGGNFNTLLVCLKAPSGIAGTGGCCPQPTGWTTDWCTALAAWQ